MSRFTSSQFLGGFNGRVGFGDFLNSRKLTGKAVEVGTHRGEFAEQLLDRWVGKVLFCVDHWMPGYDNDPAAKGDRAADYSECVTRLRRFGRRVRIHRGTSPGVAREFVDGSLDFVYIDATHQYDSVVTDLAAWWPKVKSGGILGGHDFICPGERLGGWGQFIQPAVMDFSAKHAVPIWLVPDDPGMPWSYFFEKGR